MGKVFNRSFAFFRVFVAILTTAVLFTIPAYDAGAAGKYDPRLLPIEWQYVDESDDAVAGKLFEKLLKKYPSPKDCAKLIKTLRNGRPFMTGLPAQETVKRKCTDGIEREFTYYIPPKYQPNKKFGVLMFLHGAVSQPAPGGGAYEAKELGAAVQSLDFIRIGPSTFDKHEWGEPALREHVNYALDYVKQRYNVDEDRVYIAGDSDGGRGTYAIVETEALYYAAAVPVIGAPGTVTRFVNLRNLPWFAINGDKDSIFDIAHVKKDVEDMKAMGINLEWKLVAGGEHDPFFFVKYKDEVCAFINKHPREPLPKVVDWQVMPSKDGYDQAFPANTFRWIRIDEIGEAGKGAPFEDANGTIINGAYPRIRATKKEGNCIEVEAKGIKKFTILVSDQMFDLEKEIEIRVNGAPAFKEKIANDVRAMLEEARRFNDRRLVFNNRITIDVGNIKPEEPEKK